MKPSNSSPDAGGLPQGMNRPCAITNEQRSLFRITLATALASLGVSRDDLRRWRNLGWVSFDDNLTEELDEFGDPRSAEISLIRDIARSGLSDAQIGVLLSELPKPYAYNSDRITFSFRHGWIELEPPAEIPEPSEIIEEHLDEWLSNCDQETLEDLRNRVEHALAACIGGKPSDPG